MNRNSSRTLLILFVGTLLLSFSAPPQCLAQTVSVNGGNISLTFSAPTPGSDFSDVVDNTSCSLSWNRPSGQGNNKITARSNVAQPTAYLTVEAINVSGANSSGVVPLATTAYDLVSGMAPGDGSCDLEYTASASLTDGTATDAHMVTFTITD